MAPINVGHIPSPDPSDVVTDQQTETTTLQRIIFDTLTQLRPDLDVTDRADIAEELTLVIEASDLLATEYELERRDRMA